MKSFAVGSAYQAYHQLHLPVLVIDRNLQRQYANPAFTQRYGEPPPSGSPFSDWIVNASHLTAQAQLARIAGPLPLRLQFREQRQTFLGSIERFTNESLLIQAYHQDKNQFLSLNQQLAQVQETLLANRRQFELDSVVTR